MDKLNRTLALESEGYVLYVGFPATITPRVNLTIRDLKSSRVVVNDITNRIIGCINDVCGEAVQGLGVGSSLQPQPEKGAKSILRSLLVEDKIARMSNYIHRNLTPTGISFNCRIDDREYTFSFTSREAENASSIGVRTNRQHLKDKAPPNLIESEISDLKMQLALARTLSAMEW